jgi:RNA polymerase sigma-70 factor, ECF subfamily
VSDSHEQFERIYQDCYATVQRYTARRVPAAAVQDVVADTFLTAWRRYPELSGEPLPWLLGIARRTAANQRRGGARREALHERLRGEERLSDEPPALDREALTLVAWDGLEHRVAASVMGCSTGAFTVRVHRARRKLERSLAGEKRSPIDVIREARSL